MNKFAKVLSHTMDIPPELLSGDPMLELKGREELTFSGHKGVLEYTPGRIRADSKMGPVSVVGAGLHISRMNRERLVILGRIQAITWEGEG